MYHAGAWPQPVPHALVMPEPLNGWLMHTLTHVRLVQVLPHAWVLHTLTHAWVVQVLLFHAWVHVPLLINTLAHAWVGD